MQNSKARKYFSTSWFQPILTKVCVKMKLFHICMVDNQILQNKKNSTPALILKDFPCGFPCRSFCSRNTHETPPKSAATVQAALATAQRQQCFLPPTTLTKKR